MLTQNPAPWCLYNSANLVALRDLRRASNINMNALPTTSWTDHPMSREQAIQFWRESATDQQGAVNIPTTRHTHMPGRPRSTPMRIPEAPEPPASTSTSQTEAIEFEERTWVMWERLNGAGLAVLDPAAVDTIESLNPTSPARSQWQQQSLSDAPSGPQCHHLREPAGPGYGVSPRCVSGGLGSGGVADDVFSFDDC